MVFHKNQKTAQQQGVKFKKSMLAMCIMALSAPSFAQDTTEEKDASVEEIVVTGVRANLQNAQDVKRSSDTFVDAISAEDIGSLPDRSVLEAMQRIPGVSIERFAAANDPDHFGVEGSGAVIRGMSATRSEFNGRDSFTANSGRGLSFQDVPPELMAGVQVFKNQSADMVEGGIGGTVNLITRKPFDSNDRVMAFNVDYSYGDLAEEWTPTFSGLYSDRWETEAGEFGFLINASKSSLKGISHGIQSDAYVEYRDDYSDFPRALSAPGAGHAGPNDIAGAERFAEAGRSVWMPQGSNATMKFDDRDRQGLATALQWENPEDTFLATVQFMRSDAELAWTENAIKYQSGYERRQALPLQGTEYEFDDDGLFQGGVITQDGRFSDGGWRSADPDNPAALRLPHAASWANPAVAQFGSRFQTDNRYKSTRTVIDDFATNFKWTPSDNFELSLDLQYIKANTEDDDVTVMMATHAIQDFDVSGSTPRLTLIEPWHGIRDNNMAVDSNALVVEGSEGTGPFGAAGAGVLVGGKALPGFSNDPAGDSNWFQDPTSYWWQSAMDHYERSEGDSKAARLDGIYTFDDDAGFIKAVRSGIRHANREQTVRSTAYNWGQLTPIWAQPFDQIGWADTPIVSEISGQWEEVDWSDFHGGGVITIPGNTMLHPSDALVKSIVKEQRELPTGGSGNLWENAADRPGTTGSYFLPSEVFITEETNQAAYVRVDFGSEDYSYRFDGNFGLRYVNFERVATGSVQYPDVLPRDLPPAGAPDPRNTAAHLAYLEGKRNELLAAAASNPAYNPPPLSATPTAEEISARRSYDNAFIKTDYDAATKYAGDIGNFLSPTELGFGNNGASIEDSVHDYDAWLPSFNLKVELTDDLLVRFGASKAIAMPDMDLVRNTTSLRAFETTRAVLTDTSVTPPSTTLVGGAINTWAGSSGNPYLNPMESKQYDASLEWYFANVGSLTLSLFKKDLTNFFVNGAFDRVYTNPTSGVTQTATVEGTINNGEGELEGFELAYQQFYDMLPAPFDGLGLQVTYSYIDSKAIPNSGSLDPDNGGDIDTGARVDLSGLPLQGQSKDTFNIVGMYDKDAISLRLAYNWRSRYLLTTRDVISRYPLWNDDSGFLDGSAFYKLNDNLTVGLQFTNLLNTQTETIMILDGKGLEAGRSWFVNDRRVALLLKGTF
ncbi:MULTISPECIES: TonB-dependent receptor [Cellvibrio]|uniref:TonB-dependent receptor n=1 Tax=Cellvibrio fibrivorans TaxID=126350 RepID=A0ABU1UZ37_9GAMM|nr:TonB-dependent receptor [Cellvibrio fibrivorans]MDR7090398.1 TonB-dependent receptor [Cellvibrio fibrivorans]